jgi:glycosyltransferase involved in cell wall biosynthesis
MPNEVIVVDNNCTDNSVKIAKSYKFVKVITEKSQGLSPARNRGFNSAKGDILVRIDADTQLPPDYVQKLKALFNSDYNGAATGYGVSRYEFLPRTSIFWNKVYHAYVESFLGHKVLYGANTVLLKNDWLKVKNIVINDDGAVHEDQDLSLALASVGVGVKIFPELTVSIDTSSLQTYKKFQLYLQVMHNTKKIDLSHPRSKYNTRLKTSSNYRRFLLWLVSFWAIYLYYFLVIVRDFYLRLRR